MYNEIKLEKNLYNLSGKSFTEALETLDPSDVYEGTNLAELDAYERQLKRFDIKVSGADCSPVEKFFTTTESAVLFPEFLRRAIKKGFDSAVRITAAESTSESNQYIGCTLDDTAAYTFTGESVSLPASSVSESTTAVALKKYGRIIEASYEAIRLQKLDVFAVMLKGIGIKLANSVLVNAVTVLLAGAGQITAKTAGEITYGDLTKLYGELGGFEMNTVIASPKNVAEILGLAEMSKSAAVSADSIRLPFGAEIVKTSAVSNQFIIGIDRDFALEFIRSSDLILESDKLIDRQLGRIAVSINCGFRKLTADAVKMLKVS